MPIIRVNGTEIYYELRGTGPSVLLIMGATGDAEHFKTVAELLADEFTVLTYDRRGNGRSPRPGGWTGTSVEEQADDAAALLDVLGLAPAAIFSTSTGGVFTLCLLLRHPAVAHGAVLHEPALYSLCDDPADVRKTINALVTEGMAAGGPPVTLERFWRFVAGDRNWECLPDGLRQRMLTSAETFVDERGAIASYLLDTETLNAITQPVQVLISEQSQPFFQQAGRRLAERLTVPVSQTRGSHTPYLDHPHELVQAIRPTLRQMSSK